MALEFLKKYLGPKKWYNGNTNVINKSINKLNPKKFQSEYQGEFEKKFFDIPNKALRIDRYSEYNDIVREEKEIVRRRTAELLVEMQRDKDARDAENARWRRIYREYARVSFPTKPKSKQPVVDWKREGF